MTDPKDTLEFREAIEGEEVEDESGSENFFPKEKNILIIGPAWIGDMVMAQSLFKALKQENPKINLDVLAPAWSKPLLERMPEVRQGIDLPFKHGEFNWQGRKILGRSLIGHYAQAMVLPNAWKSALIPFFAKIPKRTGWLGEWRFGLLNDLRYLNKKLYPKMVERFVALSLPKDALTPKNYPLPELIVNVANVQAAQKKYGLDTTRRMVAFCPGAEYGPAKRWPEKHFAELAQKLVKQNWQICLFGSEKEKSMGENIKRESGLTETDCLNLIGQTNLGDAIDLLSTAGLVITNDSGLMHIASALNRPTIALYGSSDPGFTPPLSANAHPMQLSLPCIPCFQRVCPLTHFNCLNQLTPDLVLARIQEIL